MRREVAQAGSASGLGPGGRRFESCLPDRKEINRKIGLFFLKNLSIIIQSKAVTVFLSVMQTPQSVKLMSTADPSIKLVFYLL